MLKAFGLTLVFWTLFTLTNSIGDAITFYAVFPHYGNMELWRLLKYFWIGFAVLTGFFARGLINQFWIDWCDWGGLPEQKWKLCTRKQVGVVVFLLLWFLLLRWILHNAFMSIWRTP